MVVARKLPLEADWNAYVADCRSHGTAIKQWLAFTETQIGAMQRRDAADLVKSSGATAAVVITSSSLSRSVVAALGWFTRVNYSYSPSELHSAFDRLGLSMTERQEIITEARPLARDVEDRDLERRLDANVA